MPPACRAGSSRCWHGSTPRCWSATTAAAWWRRRSWPAAACSTSGSGSGRDVYALAQLVGAQGEVVGVDMTDEQLDVAVKHRAWHAERFGYANVRFLHGYIERLDELDLAPASFDVIVSNCVVNLSPDKEAVLRGVQRLLKPGGEFYFSDVYADRRVPEAVRNDPVLYGECLGGALYWNDFLGLARQAGFADPRLVEDRPLAVTDPELAPAHRRRELPFRHLPPVQARRAGIRLRRLRPGRGLSRQHRAARAGPSSSTSTTASRPGACSRSAATPSACSRKAGWRRTSISSATSRATTACSRAAARHCRSPRPPGVDAGSAGGNSAGSGGSEESCGCC
jgi:SAM-dependent methyltransferase